MGEAQGAQGQQERRRPPHYFFPPYPYLTIKRATGVLLILPQSATTHVLERFQINSHDLTRKGAGTYQLATLPSADWEAVWDIRHFYNNWQHGGASQLNDPQIIAWLRMQVNDGRLAAFWLPDETEQSQISLSPADIAPLHVPPAVRDVAQWSIRHKIIAMFQAVPAHLGAAARAQFEAFITPQNLALLTGIFVAVAAAQVVPGADAVVDLVLTGLAWAMYGWAGLVAIRELIEAVIQTARAQSLADIDQASQLAADALMMLGVTLFLKRLADRGRVDNATGPKEPKGLVPRPAPTVRPTTNEMLPNFGRGGDQLKPDDLETTTSTRTSTAKIVPTGDGQSFAGHGGIEMNEDGTLPTTTVPPGTSVTVFTGPNQGLYDEAGQLIESGDTTAGLNFQNTLDPQSTTGAMTYLPGAEIPNYTLYPGPDLNILPGSMTVGSPTSLSNLLQPNMGRVNWAACTTVIGK